MNSRPARVVRGFAAAAVSTLIAAVMHTAAGGRFPHPLILLTGIMLTGILCIALTGRRVSLVRVIPSVLATQGFFHVLFTLTGSGAGLSGAGVSDESTHLHHGTIGMMPSSPADTAILGGEMTSAHLLAAAVTILALRFGESAFWGLFDTARLLLATLVRVRIPLVSACSRTHRIQADARGFIPIPVRGLIAATPHRGPPIV